MISPRLLGVYINADEIEKNIKAGDALDFNEFAVTPDAAQFLAFLKKHPVLKKSKIADEVIAKISLNGSKLYLNGVVFDSYLASAISPIGARSTCWFKLVRKATEFTCITSRPMTLKSMCLGWKRD
jgi:hypothetical protein